MTGEPLRIQVVYALPERCCSVAVDLPAGSRVGDALAKANLAMTLPGVDVDPSRLAIYGKTATLATELRDGDRVEILRPLAADPKQARRERAREAAKR